MILAMIYVHTWRCRMEVFSRMFDLLIVKNPISIPRKKSPILKDQFYWKKSSLKVDDCDC